MIRLATREQRQQNSFHYVSIIISNSGQNSMNVDLLWMEVIMVIGEEE